jgi:hypothetical protein
MKIVNVAIVLGILVSAAISSVAVMGLGDSTDDGTINSGEVIAQTQDKVVALTTLANLKVQAEGNQGGAYPRDENTGRASILVLVTNEEGAPVADLTEDNFKINTILIPPLGGGLKVTDFSNMAKGAYVFRVVPNEGTIWTKGEYDLQIRVTRGGQAIASIEIGY